jgi:hypothetical protein
MVGGVGCTNCRGKSGCNHRKGDQALAVDAALAELYPSRRWEPPAAADAPDALLADAAGLADELADVLSAATFVRPPDADTPCAFIYVLCAGRPPCAVPVRDGVTTPPAEWWQSPGRLTERYLRVALAPRAPFAVVQEIAVDVEVDPDGALVREATRPGVYSAPLLARFQKIVATLPGYGRTHLDLGELVATPPGFTAGDWPARFAGAPGVVNFLFFPEPATLTATTWIPREAA